MADLRMPNLNDVVIVGNLVRDPVLRETTNGTPVSNMTIASNRRYKDKSGEWKEDVCFVGVVAWYKLAESCAENLKQGSAVLVTGELQSRQFRLDDGGYRSMVEIKARRIQFLSKDQDLSSPNYPDDRRNQDETEKRDEYQRDDEPKLDMTDEESPKESNFDFGFKELKL